VDRPTFAALALILSAIGIYGLIAYSVGQRTQEIGIRMALGAKAADISRMILREGMEITAIGSAIGFALAATLAPACRAARVGPPRGHLAPLPLQNLLWEPRAGRTALMAVC